MSLRLPTKLEEMYPPVDLAELLTTYSEETPYNMNLDQLAQFDPESLRVAQVYNSLPQVKYCVSISLFVAETKYSPEEWMEKYIGTFRKTLQAGVPRWDGLRWKFRVYLAADMAETYLSTLLSYPDCEIYVMATASPLYQPGMLWRWLAFTDRNLEVVLATDIDEDVLSKESIVVAFLQDPTRGLSRYFKWWSAGQPDKVNDSVAESWKIPFWAPGKNYHMTLGSVIVCRPRVLDLPDMATIIKCYIRFREHQKKRGCPWAWCEDDVRSDYNINIFDHIHGWGTPWTNYGSDERFIKHILYPYAVKRGQLQSWSWLNDQRHNSVLCLESQLDFDYVNSYPGNTFVDI